MQKISVFLFIFLISFTVFAQTGSQNAQPVINGIVEWDTQRINAQISMNLAANGIRLPAGRTRAETLLQYAYVGLIRPNIMALQVDSSSTIADLIERGDLSFPEIDAFVLAGTSTAPALSPDMQYISDSHSLSISNISSSLLRHSRPAPAARTLNPVSSAQYTGIIIIAAENLPVHGMRSSALPIPCLFPKIWDSDMNIVYERNMLETTASAMVKYSAMQNIFQNNPSGLTGELQSIVGDRPLRLFARGVFGIKPTDLIIDRSDALLIISSEENRRLLSQGRVVIILDDSVLRTEFN